MSTFGLHFTSDITISSFIRDIAESAIFALSAYCWIWKKWSLQNVIIFFSRILSAERVIFLVERVIF